MRPDIINIYADNDIGFELKIKRLLAEDPGSRDRILVHGNTKRVEDVCNRLKVVRVYEPFEDN